MHYNGSVHASIRLGHMTLLDFDKFLTDQRIFCLDNY